MRRCNKNNNRLQQFMEMLTYKRPAFSKSEGQFIGRYIDSVPGMRADKFGNRYIVIGAEVRTMVSCHTDSVHDTSGRQTVWFDEKNDTILLAELPDKPKSINRWLSPKKAEKRWAKHQYQKGQWKRRECLGADDATGVYLALNMIAAGVRGLYVFHRAEEIGGYGSKHIAQAYSGILEGIDHCIALDRRGQTDIITHQMMGRCCSEEFAWVLGDLLAMDHTPCPFGSFTDSANYTGLIGEGTNVSVGYQTEHTDKESQSWGYLEALCDRLCGIDFEQLPVIRKPGEIEDWRETQRKEDEATIRARSYLDSFIDDLKAKDGIYTKSEEEAYLEWLYERDGGIN